MSAKSINRASRLRTRLDKQQQMDYWAGPATRTKNAFGSIEIPRRARPAAPLM